MAPISRNVPGAGLGEGICPPTVKKVCVWDKQMVT